MVDLYHSRRGKYRQCIYWTQKITSKKEEFVRENEPTGIFYAEETNALQTSKNQLNGVIAIDGESITLLTNDIVNDIKAGNVVFYLGKVWIVESVQFAFQKKQEQYSEGRAQTYISIKR